MRRSSQSAPFSRIALLAALPALAALGSSLLAVTAHADTKPAAIAAPADAPKPDKKTRDAARKAYAEGEKAYAAGDFAAAYSAFSKALGLIPTPAAGYWAAKSLDQQGKTDDAIQAYEALLSDPNAGRMGSEKMGDAQTRVATLKAGQVGEVTVSSAALGAQLSVDGLLQAGPMPVLLKLAPGPHKLVLTAPGYDAKEVDLELQAGSKLDQKIDLVEHIAPPEPLPIPEVVPPTPLPPPPPPVEKHSKVPAYVTLGIATGAAVVGTIFGVQALKSKSDFDSAPSSKNADDTERNALIADMAFGVAVTLGVTGIVLLTSNDDSAAQAARLHLPTKGTFRVTPYFGRESGGAAARLTF